MHHPLAPSDAKNLTRSQDHLASSFTAWMRACDVIPGEQPDSLQILRLLYAAGRNDLSFARLLEGHLDAIQILQRVSHGRTTEQVRDLVEAGATFGVWNADLPGASLKVTQDRLFGGKAFASGAGLLTHALATLHAGDTDNVQLLLIDLQETPPLIDTSWWTTIGMQESETHLVRWNGPKFQESWMIGRPGDYETEPAFSGGAIRFCAAQAGAIASIFDLVRNHLVETDRCEAPHQSARLARLYSCAALSAGIVREIACKKKDMNAEIYLAAVAHARTVVTEQAERAIMLAQQSVGVASMFREHPLARTMSDLMVYLRQPSPDAQRHKVGQAATAGLLVPDL